jgi:hypothetical protein
MKATDFIEKIKRAVKRFFSTGKAITAEEFIEKNRAEIEEVNRLADEQNDLMEERNILEERIGKLSNRILKILSDVSVKKQYDQY